ncbi:hypothetical protein HanHA89_Chr08g0280411 [Helianthus annuus]|nr:hypothetical protein HanHA89_Chr08g0280411 [Helianthus annuus]
MHFYYSNLIGKKNFRARGSAPWTPPGAAAPGTPLPGTLPPDPRQDRKTQ